MRIVYFYHRKFSELPHHRTLKRRNTLKLWNWWKIWGFFPRSGVHLMAFRSDVPINWAVECMNFHWKRIKCFYASCERRTTAVRRFQKTDFKLRDWHGFRLRVLSHRELSGYSCFDGLQTSRAENEKLLPCLGSRMQDPSATNFHSLSKRASERGGGGGVGVFRWQTIMM